MRVIGIILIITGVLMFIFRGFNFTQEKKVVDLGPLEINKKEKKSVSWPLYAGGIAVAAGVVVLLAGKRKISRTQLWKELAPFVPLLNVKVFRRTERTTAGSCSP